MLSFQLIKARLMSREGFTRAYGISIDQGIER
jgi:hypothetical protein